MPLRRSESRKSLTSAKFNNKRIIKRRRSSKKLLQDITLSSARLNSNMLTTKEPTILDFLSATGETLDGGIKMKGIGKYIDRRLVKLSTKWSRVVSKENYKHQKQEDKVHVSDFIDQLTPTLTPECARLEVEAISLLSPPKVQSEEQPIEPVCKDVVTEKDDDGIKQELKKLNKVEESLAEELDQITLDTMPKCCTSSRIGSDDNTEKELSDTENYTATSTSGDLPLSSEEFNHQKKIEATSDETRPSSIEENQTKSNTNDAQEYTTSDNDNEKEEMVEVITASSDSNKSNAIDYNNDSIESNTVRKPDYIQTNETNENSSNHKATSKDNQHSDVPINILVENQKEKQHNTMTKRESGSESSLASNLTDKTDEITSDESSGGKSEEENNATGSSLLNWLNPTFYEDVTVT